MKEGESFLDKHTKANDTVLGPWIEGNRWVVEKKRKHHQAVKLIRSSLVNGGEKIGVAKLVSKILKKEVDIY